MKLNRLLGLCLAAGLLMVLLAAPAMAKVVAPSDQFYFLDQADVLSEATEGEIFFSNQLLEEACGAQMVVVTLDTTGSTSIDDYATQLLKQWGVGDAKKQNGFVLLLAIKDDDYYAVCGSNLQPKFTSGMLKQYFDDYLEADFAAKRYDAGVKKFFEAAFERIADTYDADVTIDQGIAAYQDWLSEGVAEPMVAVPGGMAAGQGGMVEEESDGMMGMIVLILLVVLVVLLVTRSRRRRRMYMGGPTVTPIIINNTRPRPGGLFGPRVGAGGHRGATPPPPPAGGQRGTNNGASFGTGFGVGLGRSTGLFGGASRPSGSSRPSSSSGRSSSGSFGSIFGSSSRSSGGSRSFGSARGGGGGTRGGGAGRGRH